MAREFAILFDGSKCIGCKACQVACKSWYELPAEATELGESFNNPPDLTPHTWLRIHFVERVRDGDFRWYFQRISCMHCDEPPCVYNCPTTAIRKLPEGPVVIDQALCIGCYLCVQTCPFGVPRVQPGEGAFKCTMCADRIAAGRKPACVESCPVDALEFGEKSVLREKARSRAAAIGGYVYGDQEAGGTSVFYVTQVPPRELGLPEVPPVRMSARVAGLMARTGLVGVVIGAIIGGLAFLTRRRRRVAELGGGEKR